jgi:hypothetical protein
MAHPWFFSLIFQFQSWTYFSDPHPPYPPVLVSEYDPTAWGGIGTGRRGSITPADSTAGE